MRGMDLGSWQGILSTALGLALITLIGVSVRLIAMYTIQQRRERENRQINERLKTLIAAYKTIGGSFTGDLTVDPAHLRDLRQRASEGAADSPAGERGRRMRDAVEAALSDIILLGTDEQVRLAARAAEQLVAGQPVHTGELVVSLRTFVRKALALEPVPDGLAIPSQGPTRPALGGGARGRGEEGRGGRGGRGGGGGMMAGGAGMGLGMVSGGAEGEASGKDG